MLYWCNIGALQLTSPIISEVIAWNSSKILSTTNTSLSTVTETSGLHVSDVVRVPNVPLEALDKDLSIILNIVDSLDMMCLFRGY